MCLQVHLVARVVRALAAGGQAAVREAAALLSAALDSAALLSAGQVGLCCSPPDHILWHALQLSTLPATAERSQKCVCGGGSHKVILLCTRHGRSHSAACDVKDAWSHSGISCDDSIWSCVTQLAVYHACTRVALSGLPGVDASAAAVLLRCFDAPGFVGALLAAGAEEASGRGGARSRDEVCALCSVTISVKAACERSPSLTCRVYRSAPCPCRQQWALHVCSSREQRQVGIGLLLG